MIIKKQSGYLIFGILLASLVFVLINSMQSSTPSMTNSLGEDQNQPPEFLTQQFPKTDWTKINPKIHQAISGGPKKDGIPSLDSPKFIPISEFDGEGTIQTIFVESSQEKKAYPYSILVWHEIVNDTIGDKKITVTFCPLCGSAAVYDRVIEGNETSFGVSGALIESNMVMYDRNTESMWQQTTGESLAGAHLGSFLPRVNFQLLSVQDIKNKHPTAQILSNDTGYQRDYSRNPYSGYEESEEFIFSPSKKDIRYPQKQIFVAYKLDQTNFATPWLHLENNKSYSLIHHGKEITLSKRDNELQIADEQGKEIPFYFEMWFSWAVQNQTNSEVFDPKDN
jgi:hypothetical protein